MTNKEWLDYLAQNAPDELAAWFDAEHVENRERALDGDTEPENEDSRERLEADVREWIDIATYKKFTPERMLEVMLHWLDRQAAITDAEWDDELEQLHMGYKPLIDGLQKQLDELTAERDELKFDISLVRKNRDKYRSKFGKCLDYADAIHALMDDEGIA